MNRAEKKVEKEILRAECEAMRQKIYNSIFVKQAIPQCVVNGSLDAVKNYKENCENVGRMDRIKRPVKERRLDKLHGLKKMLHEVARKLHIAEVLDEK